MKESFLGWLQGELAKVTTFSSPEEKIREGEEVIGEMDDNLKRLYTVFAKSANEMVELSSEHALAHLTGNCSEEKCDEFHRRRKRHEILKDIFWHDVRGSASEDCPNIGIRDDFKIVKMPESESPLSGLDGLGALIGAMVLGGKLKSEPEEPKPEKRRASARGSRAN